MLHFTDMLAPLMVMATTTFLQQPANAAQKVSMGIINGKADAVLKPRPNGLDELTEKDTGNLFTADITEFHATKDGEVLVTMTLQRIMPKNLGYLGSIGLTGDMKEEGYEVNKKVTVNLAVLDNKYRTNKASKATVVDGKEFNEYGCKNDCFERVLAHVDSKLAAVLNKHQSSKLS